MSVLLVGMLLCACDTNEPEREVTIPVSICLPAGEVYAAQAPTQRVFGDPGTTEEFRLPNYLYFFIVQKGDGDTWKVWHVQTHSVNDGFGTTDEKLAAWNAKWEKKHYIGKLATEGDSIYQYNADLNILLGTKGFRGEVYAIATAVPLTFSRTIAVNDSRADLLGLTFSFDGTKTGADDEVNNLQHIYSTPYNYNNVKGDYYGSFYAEQNVPRLNLLLYHVAAKVDLMWNVNEDIRSSVKISYIAAENLYNGPCYVFKPTENQPDNDNLDEDHVYKGGYTKKILDALSPGTQWNGRAYFYAIPYKNNETPTQHYPLKLRLQKGNDSPSGDNYYSKIVPTDIPEVWTSWIRGQITINTATYNVVAP